ncbi:MAG: hypothetical protein ACP5NP_15760 [Acetobacteraceae bacterium]
MRRMVTAAALAGAMLMGGRAAVAGELWHCLNAASGAGWTLRLDSAAGTVNGHKARFGANHVYWTEANGAAADLVRGRGVLTVTRGSSTGGWVQVVRCRRTP